MTKINWSYGNYFSSVLVFKLSSSQGWASEVYTFSKIVALSQLRSVEVLLLLLSLMMNISHVWSAKSGVIMEYLSLSVKVSCLVLASVELVVLWLASRCLSIKLNWRSGSSWWSLNQVNDWFLDYLINLSSDLSHLLFSIKVSSHDIISLNEWVKFSLKFSILRSQELWMLVEWF